MKTEPSDRRLVENEAYFRSLNQKVQKGIDAVNTVAAQDGQEPIEIDANTPLFFLCGCADEDCVERIRISPNAYNEIHQDPRAFCIAHNHQVDRIEAVLSVELDYTVVRKYDMPPETVASPHKTSLNNSAG